MRCEDELRYTLACDTLHYILCLGIYRGRGLICPRSLVPAQELSSQYLGALCV